MATAPATKPEILALTSDSPQLDPLLEENYVVHRLNKITDHESFFREIGPRICALQGSGMSKVPASLIDSLPGLEVIVIHGVGYDGYDLAAAKRRGIAVANTPHVLDDSVADLAMGLILAQARQLPQSDAFVRSGQWLQGSRPLGRRVTGARLGIVGLGNIGLHLARRAAAFEMRIAYHNRHQRPDVAYAYCASLEDLARQSDFMVVLTPGGAATHHLINESVLRALGSKGVLVNVSRGSVVDEAALVRCLREGALGGAALDVYEKEPCFPQELAAMSNVVLVPHLGSATLETRQMMADLVMRNLQAHFAGKPVVTPVQAT